MARHYSTRAFFRQMPNDLLARYFGHRAGRSSTVLQLCGVALAPVAQRWFLRLFKDVPCPIGKRTSTMGAMCTENACRRARQRFRMLLVSLRFRLFRGAGRVDSGPTGVGGSGQRGSEVVHKSGRRIVRCDNSPAVWACWLAVAGETPTIAKVREWFECDKIPVALAVRREEKNLAKFCCTLRQPNLNTRGWKLCHVEDVGMNKRMPPLNQIPIAEVKRAFCRLLDPGNYFLLPKELGGLGEVEVFVKELTCVI